MDSAFANVGLLLINTLFGLYMLVVMLRLLLQLVRADFYNPLSQFVVKATNPLLIPLRRIIPAIGGLDTSSLLLAYLVQATAIALIMLLAGMPFNPIAIVMWSGVGVLALIVNIYFWGLIITIVASWIAPMSQNPALLLIRQILEPVTKPIRNMLPDLGGIDISPIFLFLAIQIVDMLVVKQLGAVLGVPPGLIVGL